MTQIKLSYPSLAHFQAVNMAEALEAGKPVVMHRRDDLGPRMNQAGNEHYLFVQAIKIGWMYCPRWDIYVILPENRHARPT